MIELQTITKIAVRAIKANKMRSVLTSLGIIIGVAAVIVMLSIGNGAQISLQTEICYGCFRLSIYKIFAEAGN